MAKRKEVAEEAPVVELTKEEVFTRDCKRCKMEPTDFGKVVEYDKIKYTITGLEIRNTKYPVETMSAATERLTRFPLSILLPLL